MHTYLVVNVKLISMEKTGLHLSFGVRAEARTHMDESHIEFRDRNYLFF
jgi:hypothetical protein